MRRDNWNKDFFTRSIFTETRQVLKVFTDVSRKKKIHQIEVNVPGLSDYILYEYSTQIHFHFLDTILGRFPWSIKHLLPILAMELRILPFPQVGFSLIYVTHWVKKIPANKSARAKLSSMNFFMAKSQGGGEEQIQG